MSKNVDTEFPDRLAQAATHAKVEHSPTALGKFLGVNKQTAATWMSGSLPRADKLFEYADRFGVDARWFATGQGDMLARAPLEGLPAEEASLLDRYRSSDRRWQLSLRLLSMVATERIDEVAESVNMVLARIFAKPIKPVADERVEQALATSRHGFPPGKFIERGPIAGGAGALAHRRAPKIKSGKKS
jgi:transcriptional regulator with XRE-family HTH domain